MRVRSHQLGLDAPVAAELEGQPVMAVAEVGGHCRCRPGDSNRRSGSASPARSARTRPSTPGVSRATGRSLEPSRCPLHCAPRRAIPNDRGQALVRPPAIRRDRQDHPGRDRPRLRTAIPGAGGEGIESDAGSLPGFHHRRVPQSLQPAASAGATRSGRPSRSRWVTSSPETAWQVTRPP